MDFWTNLERAIEVVESNNTAKMAEFLDAYRGLWPHIEADIEKDPHKRALFERALSLK